MVVRSKSWAWWLGAAGLLCIGLAIYILIAQPQSAADTATPREHYAALYDAAWRQDDGRQTTLMTATLLVPPSITLLGQDTNRSSTEEQLWKEVRALQANQIAIALTIDSVDGTLSDADLQRLVHLREASGIDFSLDRWTPLVAPSRVVNASTASSRLGVLVFTAKASLDWTSLQALTLSVDAWSQQKSRQFTWAQPTLLLQAE